MYRYNHHDQALIEQRVAQFRDQVRRRLSGELSEDDFKPLRLRNGLYLQRHAYMLRVAVPYGVLSSRQLRMLAHIARAYDRGFGHFTTRQNIQFNWPALERVPDILGELARVQMHAIQTSGNCVRNITSDPLAGVAADEIEDPRPYCEALRQWSTLHPEFAWLPRKFKIAVTGAIADRAATQLHDIGLRLTRTEGGDVGFRVLVGGGMGRTPVIGKTLREFLPKRHLLSYVEAILRVYNLQGRRDNLHKARIKILVNKLGINKFRELVEAEWSHIKDGSLMLTNRRIEDLAAHFHRPPYADVGEQPVRDSTWMLDTRFATWYKHNTEGHRHSGYRIVHVSLKAPGVPPGDMTAAQMDVLADLADRYSFGEIRTTHEQNLVLADVAEEDLPSLWRALQPGALATPNIGTLSDMICCPGLDFCALANAGSIPIAERINRKFHDLDRLYDLGEIKLKMSGCVNACGHHHVGHIGILGVDKHGKEWYQYTLGGSADDAAQLGERIGPAVPKQRVVDVLERILNVYIDHRLDGERFLGTVRRIGITPFREHVYANHSESKNRSQRMAALAG